VGVLGIEDLVDGRIGMRSSIYALRGSVRIADHWEGGSDPNPRYATALMGPYLGQKTWSSSTHTRYTKYFMVCSLLSL